MHRERDKNKKLNGERTKQQSREQRLRLQWCNVYTLAACSHSRAGRKGKDKISSIFHESSQASPILLLMTRALRNDSYMIEVMP